jgi:hypothetical protein
MKKPATQKKKGIMAIVRMFRRGQAALPAEAKSAQQLDQILSRVRYIGPQPPPTEDELMDMVAEEIQAVRAQKHG